MVTKTEAVEHELDDLTEVTKTTTDLMRESANTLMETVRNMDRDPVSLTVKLPAAVVSTQLEMVGIALDFWSDLIWGVAVGYDEVRR